MITRPEILEGYDIHTLKQYQQYVIEEYMKQKNWINEILDELREINKAIKKEEAKNATT